MTEKRIPHLATRVRGFLAGRTPERAQEQVAKPAVEIKWANRDKEGKYTVGEDRIPAVPVGDARSVSHLTFHDMRDNAVTRAMTEAIQTEELAADAVHVARTDRTSDVTATTVYQPLKITKAH